MDQIKIGKFIAECRKKNNLTQMQLAEKLNITDRAISKWENGKAMPDSSIMLDLCNELKISVNELLSGEMIEMKDYDKKTEGLLIEMAKKEELNNKRLMRAMYVIVIMSVVALVSIVCLAQYFVVNTVFKNTICVIATIVALATMYYGLKLEVDAGYYECKKCHHKFVPTYKEVLWSTHIGTTRHLKCPNCNEKSWCKKVMNKS
jgi:transcriptional regulator with XRE-family HTH domain/DNA-directed RNA polymerase subunit RPC12/RpoP